MNRLENVNKIIIHCSASDHPNDDSLQAITDLHMGNKSSIITWAKRMINGRGFEAVGYHYIITKDGKNFKGRGLEFQGAHCYGQNEHSIGICLTGLENFTLAQYRTLLNLIDTLKHRYNLENGDVYGHYHFSKKSCPNFIVNLN